MCRVCEPAEHVGKGSGHATTLYSRPSALSLWPLPSLLSAEDRLLLLLLRRLGKAESEQPHPTPTTRPRRRRRASKDGRPVRLAICSCLANEPVQASPVCLFPASRYPKAADAMRPHSSLVAYASRGQSPPFRCRVAARHWLRVGLSPSGDLHRCTEMVERHGPLCGDAWVDRCQLDAGTRADEWAGARHRVQTDSRGGE